MPEMNNLKDFLGHQLKDLYSAESQLIAALPKAAEKATSPKLRKAIEAHLEETKGQRDRVEQAAKKLGVKVTGHKCKAMEGLVKETEDFFEHDCTDAVRDVGIIANAQRIEHYEISAYGTAIQYAKQCGESEVQQLLEQNLEQEKDADERLNDLAISEINAKAMA